MKSTIPIQPFQDQGHYTEVHNLAFDFIMPRVSANAWKVLSLIIRKTKGWGKKSDEIAYAKIKEGTGIKSDPTVSAALKQLLHMGCILRKPGATQFEGTRYALNRNFSIAPAAPPATSTEELPTIENVVGDSATEIDAATFSVAGAATENVAVPAIEIKDTKATNQYEETLRVGECKSEPRGASENSRPPDSPTPTKSNQVSVLDPPPGEAPDTRALARICRVNTAHPDPRDTAKWSAAVATVRAALPAASPQEREKAVSVFEARWKNGGQRGSPYLSNVINHFLRVISDDESEVSHGKSEFKRLEKRAPSASESAWDSAIENVME